VSKQVNGYLASDGTFFEDEPECQRYEYQKELSELCDTHSINFENFLAILNSWHRPIEGYYNADDNCKAHQVGKQTLDLDTSDRDTEGDEPLLPTEEHIPNSPIRDRDTPGFLEQSLRKY
jgi:hypothetical protein